jgi:amino acid transporter
MPESLGRIHPRYLTPHVSTILMGALSIVWYVGLTIVSENILFDSIAALGPATTSPSPRTRSPATRGSGSAHRS